MGDQRSRSCIYDSRRQTLEIRHRLVCIDQGRMIRKQGEFSYNDADRAVLEGTGEYLGMLLLHRRFPFKDLTRMLMKSASSVYSSAYVTLSPAFQAVCSVASTFSIAA